jgi:hypothetical protein
MINILQKELEAFLFLISYFNVLFRRYCTAPNFRSEQWNLWHTALLFLKWFSLKCHLNLGKNQNIWIANESFENVAKFKYLGRTLTNKNDIHDEIKSRLNSGNACYYSVQNLLSSRIISKNLKIKIYKTVISLLLLYGCETWSLTLKEEHRLRVFENRV